MRKLNELNKKILAKITPTKADKAKITALAEDLRRKVAILCEEQDITAAVRIEGSHRDTSHSPEILFGPYTITYLGF